MSTKTDLKAAMKPRTRKPAASVASTLAAASEVSVVEAELGETKPTSVRLPVELHKRARLYSVEHGVTLNALVAEGLVMRLERGEKA